jgi:hypothetical protein
MVNSVIDMHLRTKHTLVLVYLIDFLYTRTVYRVYPTDQ